MISNKVMKVCENTNSVMYRAMCECGSVDCDMTIDIEKDTELQMIFINFYKNLSWSSYNHTHNSIMDFLYRIKCAFKILFTGSIKIESEFILREDGLKTFIEALEEARTKLEKLPAIYFF